MGLTLRVLLSHYVRFAHKGDPDPLMEAKVLFAQPKAVKKSIRAKAEPEPKVTKRPAKKAHPPQRKAA